MAKIINPLFSIAAEGSIGRAITFRGGDGAATARLYSTPSGSPTDAQAACRLRASWAASVFSTLTVSDRLKWQAAADQRALPIFALYMREFIDQYCNLSVHPQIPGELP